ncbi:MAG TPA: ornithine carbamoyltransferase [Nevskiales bacterium]|nr:ornithine carbamoyltransferase [Nevskiales bacterium]
MAKRDFLTLMDCTPQELRRLIERAIELKRMLRHRDVYEPLKNRTLAMLFEKSSTRTRVSFEVAMAQFGGHALFLSPRDTQLGRGEPVADTARVLGRMADAVMIRNHSQAVQQEFAAHSPAPVINGLSNLHHPCQLLADMQTWLEHRGEIRGRTAAWIGDGNNMCHSWIEGARQFGYRLRIAAPRGYAPNADILAAAGDTAVVVDSPEDAVRDADLVVTDVWASMGQESEQTARAEAFRRYQVNEALMALARPDALFMHCLPAHRGEEVTAAVIDGPHSVVWDEAENRLHAQKALLEFLLT